MIDEQKRLIVRPRYVGPAEGGGPLGGGSYQVVDNGVVLATFQTQQEAARRVLELDGRIALTWGRMAIGGKTAPRDFEATWFEDTKVGRVYYTKGGAPGTDGWFWSMYAHLSGRMGNASGRETERKAAAANVERAFTDLMARASIRRNASRASGSI